MELGVGSRVILMESMPGFCYRERSPFSIAKKGEKVTRITSKVF